jgi:hypothetical protein
MATGLAVAAVVFIAFVVGVLLGESHVRESGELATARVLDVQRPWRGASTADVRFVTEDGTRVSAELDVDFAEASPERGDHIEVRYRREDPAGSVVVAHIDRVAYWAFVGPCVLGLACLAAWPAYRAVGPALRPPARHLARPGSSAPAPPAGRRGWSGPGRVAGGPRLT